MHPAMTNAEYSIDPCYRLRWLLIVPWVCLVVLGIGWLEYRPFVDFIQLISFYY